MRGNVGNHEPTHQAHLQIVASVQGVAEEATGKMAPATNHKISLASELHRPRARVDEGRPRRQGEVPVVLRETERKSPPPSEPESDAARLRETERKRAFDVNRMQTELWTAFLANVHEGSMRIARRSERPEPTVGLCLGA